MFIKKILPSSFEFKLIPGADWVDCDELEEVFWFELFVEDEDDDEGGTSFVLVLRSCVLDDARLDRVMGALDLEDVAVSEAVWDVEEEEEFTLLIRFDIF